METMIESRWWDPGELRAHARGVRENTPGVAFFSNAFKSVREAIAVSEFALRRPWNRDWQVSPVPQHEQFPDVELRCGDDVRQFEIVEADRESRRRLDEYRAMRGRPLGPEHVDPDEEVAIAPREILRVIRKKWLKRYASRPNLLVYVNLWPGEPSSLFADGLASEYRDGFKSAWLLWGPGTFRLWPNPARIKASASALS